MSPGDASGASRSLAGRSALVTGASSGIGRAVAVELGRQGASLWLVGRDEGRLNKTRSRLPAGCQAQCVVTDIGSSEAVAALAQTIPCADPGVLVHCAGLYASGRVADGDTAGFERLLRVNVCGVYDLTAALLPRLVRARGDIVFVNSSIVRRATPVTGQFAATQHALRALADSLREEVNDQGVRVLSIYPGRTATPRQARIFAAESRDYTPERLLQPEDVAAAVGFCLQMPRTAEVTDLFVRPANK